MEISNFKSFLNEKLSDEMMKEPSSEAAKQAKKMNLNYVGFGRYTDRTGQVKYIVKNDKLYPFKGKDQEQANIQNLDQQQEKESMKGKPDANTSSSITKSQNASVSALKTDEKIKAKYAKDNQKTVLTYDKHLKSFYSPDLFTPDEINAISDYTTQSFTPINRYLYKGFDPETTPDQANAIVQQIQNMDNAFEDSGAPFDYTVYTGLDARYNYQKIIPGNSYVFRGYVSASLNHDIAIDQFSLLDQDIGVVLEIQIKQGQKSIYLGNISEKPGEFETLLPRGTQIQVLGGPFMIDSDITTTQNYPNKPIAFFTCAIAE